MVDHSLLLRKSTANSLGWFPKWALDEEAADITIALCNKLEREDKPVWWAAPCVCGPAVLYSFKANALVWFLFLSYPLIGLLGTSCNSGVANYKLWVWLPFFLIEAITLYLEFRCASYIMPFHIMVAKPKIFGYECSFNGWLAITAALSVFSRTEYVTVSLFMVKTFKTSQCGNGAADFVWQQVLQQSSVPFLSGVTMPTFALVLWLLMLAQTVYAFAASIPTSANTNPQANSAPVDYQLKPDTDDRVVYDTLLGTGRHHNEVLAPLAQAARMSMPTDMNGSFLAIVWPFTSGQRICDDMQQNIAKFGAFVLLHSALQPNLQTSSLAVMRAATDRPLDEQTVFSSCLSLLVALKALYTEFHFVHLAWRTLEKKDSSTVKRRAAKLWYIFCIMTALYVFFIFYAAIKLYKAWRGCPQGVWNISGCATVILPST